jgi:hypothetical protein
MSIINIIFKKITDKIVGTEITTVYHPNNKPFPKKITLEQQNIFNSGNIISDNELLNVNSMTEQQIQEFLTSKNSFLSTYKIEDKLISYWIKKYTDENGINPQILITNMQKEQGLISQKTLPTKQRRLDYGLGVGAYDDHDDHKWKGFDKQILGSVIVCKKKYDSSLKFKYPLQYIVGEKKSIKIENAATRMLYFYTPWIGDSPQIICKIKYNPPFGNYLFYLIYSKWFKK